MERREFLKLLGGLPFFYNVLPDVAVAAPAGASNAVNALILVELKGGNDGLNTLVPYKEQKYYAARPALALAEKDILPLDKSVGMHSALEPLLATWQAGDLAWIQGVGYPNQVRSHFRSIDIWNTAKPDVDDEPEGWVAQVLKGRELMGVAVGSTLGPLFTSNLSAVGIVNPKQFANMGRKVEAVDAPVSNPALEHVLTVQDSVHDLSGRFQQALASVPEPKHPFPNHAFGKAMAATYRLVASDLQIPVYKVSLGSFDTHINQLPAHATKLKQLSETLAALQQNLQAINQWDSTLVLTYSEFGRRLAENANQGTDHGAAAPHLIMGGKVKGGLHGQYPSFANLDDRGDLIHNVDFRDIYASIARDWWQVNSTKTHQPLNLIRV